MRLVAVLALGVAVAAAAAVVALGRESISREPLDEGYVALEELSWAERASAECVDHTGRIRAAIAAPAPEYDPDATRTARLYVETTQIERSLIAALRAIPGRPPRATETLEIFHRRNVRDLEVAAVLRRSFDRELVERELADYERVAAELRQRFRTHGAIGCVAYLDPETYEN